MHLIVSLIEPQHEFLFRLDDVNINDWTIIPLISFKMRSFSSASISLDSSSAMAPQIQLRLPWTVRIIIMEGYRLFLFRYVRVYQARVVR